MGSGNVARDGQFPAKGGSHEQASDRDCVGTAGAADLPMKAPPMVAPPVHYGWTGCYVGAGLGYGMWNQDASFETLPGLFQITQTTVMGGRGWFGTGQVGCDYQFNGPFVIGAFVDGDWGNLHGNVQPVPLLAANEKESRSWAVGGRVGYEALPRLLTFVSGGWTQAHFDRMDLTLNLAPALWAHKTLPAKNTLTDSDARIIEDAFARRLASFEGPLEQTGAVPAAPQRNAGATDVGTAGMMTAPTVKVSAQALALAPGGPHIPAPDQPIEPDGINKVRLC
jgi:hypothetical protein